MIEPRLTLQSMLELTGVVVFIELLLELLIKPALKGRETEAWYGLVVNALCFLLGFMGSCIASAALGILTSQQLASNLFLALEASLITTYGYEVVKHVKRVLPQR